MFYLNNYRLYIDDISILHNDILYSQMPMTNQVEYTYLCDTCNI